jgi:hypothetical protein
MFNFFKRNKKEKLPQLTDLNDNHLQQGDIVEVFRYNLGKCRLILVEETYYYESLDSGEQISWLKMIDASNDRQKVKKLFDE